MIMEGDARDVMAALGPGSIDLIYTDPPYPRADAVPCFEILAELSKTVLVDGGSLVTIAPHYLLEWVVLTMGRSGLKYRWMYVMNQTAGPHPRMAMGIEVLYKPMLHYVKRAYPSGRGFLRDMVDIPAKEKGLHKWQQPEAWAEYYIEKLCPPGGTVLDPFAGVGTAGVVAKKLGRKSIMIDSDRLAVVAMRTRMKLLEENSETKEQP